MKRIISYLIIFGFIFGLYIPNIFAGTSANTIFELRKEVSALKAKKQANENKKKQTKTQIENTKNNIYSNKKSIEQGQAQIESAKQEISALNIEIDNTQETIKKMINNYEITKGENIYLDYVFNSKSYADLVYRYALIGQIVDYNNEQITSWKTKIKYNEELQIELAQKEIELNNQLAQFEKDINNLGDKLNDILEITMDISDEINSTQELLNYYVSIGCDEHQDLEECVKIKGDTSFRRPLGYGTITSYYGYRIHPIKKINQFHAAIDIGGNKEGTNIYSTSNGMVGKIIRKASCGGNQVYVFHTINGKRYTTAYFHLLAIKVSIGDLVTSNTVVGTVGGGKGTRWDGCSTGAHLHFVIATGWYGCSPKEPGCYTSYSTFIANTVNPKEKKYLNLPSKGTYWFTR